MLIFPYYSTLGVHFQRIYLRESVAKCMSVATTFTYRVIIKLMLIIKQKTSYDQMWSSEPCTLAGMVTTISLSPFCAIIFSGYRSSPT